MTGGRRPSGRHRSSRLLGPRWVRVAVMAGLFVAGLGAGAAYATFSATTTNSVSLSAAGDLKGPTSTAQTVTPTGGAIVAGYIAQGGTFYVYANVVDNGNPPSGVASVTADVSSVSTAQVAVPLVAGSYTVAGVTYNYRSGSVTANGSLAEGAYSYALTSADFDGNVRTQSGFVLTVDNTAPTAGGTVAPTSGAAAAGFIRQGGTYYVYANASDAGAGVFSVSAGMSAISAGQAAVPLVAGSYSAAGVSYGYRSASLTADNPLSEGTYAFTVAATDNAGNATVVSSNASVDDTAPTAAATLAPIGGAVTCGFTKQNTNDYVYANVAGGGTPNSGIFTVTANISSISAGQTAVPLVVGSYTCGGIAYNFRSGSVADNAVVAAGSYTYSITSTDNASNVQTQSFSVVVDNALPTITRQTLGPTVGATTCSSIRQGATYYYYAQVSDASSGVNTVTTNVSAISAGQTAVPLVAGAFTCGATAYNYRSAAITADNPKAEGSYTMTLTLTDNASNVRNTNFTAKVDNSLPSVTTTTIAPNAGTGVGGYIKQNLSYRIYANVADAGSPASGISSVKANVSTITAGQSAVTLSSGNFTVGGVTYNYRSGAITSDNPKAEGIYSYSIATTDNASNSQTQSGYTVTVENTLPTVGTTAIALTSGANVSGYVKQGAAYYVYANVSDTGTFVSGLFTVTTNVSSLTTGQTTAAMTAGSYSFGGTSYTYRTAAITANASLTEGAKTYSVTATDNAQNVKTVSLLPVTVDNTAPSVSTTTIAPTSGAAAGGYVQQGGAYYVYANVTDAASGVATVTADVSAVSAGQTAVPLVAGSYSFAGTNYSHRSGVLTVDNPRAQGSYAYSITSTDNISNGQTQSGYAVTVDNTAPTVTATTVAPTSGATTAGYVRQGGPFYVYANVTDVGGTPGIVTADVSSVSAGQSTVSLVAGSYVAGGVSYNYRSGSVNADNPKAEGSYAYTITASDNAVNTTNLGSTLAVDNTAPTVASSTIAQTSGTLAGFIKQGSTYYVYANVTDAGSPTSGLSTVTANVSTVSAGQTAVVLVAGSYTSGGVNYNYRTGSITTDNPKADGSYSYTVTATDNASNTQAPSATVVVDSSGPTVSTTVVARATGEAPGYLKQGDAFFVYANVSDGSPASGIATVTSDVSAIATGQTSVTLTSGSYTVGGVTYNYRSASVTSTGTLADGAYTYSITSTDQLANQRSQSFSVTVDDTAPSITAKTIAKTAGGTVGSVHQGGTYYVYANVTDAGSGVGTVTADVSSITGGQTSATLAAGSYSAGGVSYNYRSASLTVDNPKAGGSYTYSISVADNLSNGSTQGGFSVTVDNTSPSGSDIQAANVNTIVGRAQINDTVTYTFSETMDPSSILAGWTGASTSVVVRFNNNAGGTGNDTVTIYDAGNATQLSLGTIDLGRSDYTTSNITFGATGTTSKMVQSGAAITITLGTQSAAATTAAATGTMTWVPSSAASDAAGNTCSTATVTESGAADKEF